MVKIDWSDFHILIYIINNLFTSEHWKKLDFFQLVAVGYRTHFMEHLVFIERNFLFIWDFLQQESIEEGFYDHQCGSLWGDITATACVSAADDRAQVAEGDSCKKNVPISYGSHLLVS